MSETEFGTLRFEAEGRLWSIISEATAGRFDKYSELYVNATDDRIVTVANTPAQKFISYCTFEEGYSLTGTNELEVVFDIDDLASYFDFVSGAGDVELTFHGADGARLPTYYTITSALQATVYTKSNEEDLQENFALGITQKFNDDDQFMGRDGPLSVAVEGDVEQFYRISEAVDADKLNLSMHPFVVDGQEVKLEATDDKQRNQIQGSLNVKVVEGGDVSNLYNDRFEDVFGHLTGKVEVQTEQDSVLVAVSGDGDDVYRHTITPAGA